MGLLRAAKEAVSAGSLVATRPKRQRAPVQRGAAGSSPALEVEPLREQDAAMYIQLQDQLAQHHLNMLRPYYPKVSFTDCQSLLCDHRLLGNQEGRLAKVCDMIKKEQAVRGMHILKVSVRIDKKSKGTAEMVGFLAYSVLDGEWRRLPTSGRGRAAMSKSTFIQVHQIYVKEAYRRMGLGRKLFDYMAKAAGPEAAQDVRLSVCELNSAAVKMYRSLGFHIEKLTASPAGDRADCNMLAWLGMRRLFGSTASSQKAPSLFKSEVVGEVCTIRYPKEGAFAVRITKHLASKGWHGVNSLGLSTWDGEDFSDTIDLNNYFARGLVDFHRPLSLAFHDAELKKKASRKQKADARAAASQQAFRKPAAAVSEPPKPPAKRRRVV